MSISGAADNPIIIFKIIIDYSPVMLDSKVGMLLNKQ
jgi:hypothetical protein